MSRSGLNVLTSNICVCVVMRYIYEDFDNKRRYLGRGLINTFIVWCNYLYMP